jgi:DNA mismatch endonuclease, patch repair protein
MRAQRQRDTKPETALRSELHRRGLRFFVHRRPLSGLNRTVDVIFPRIRVCIDVRGCFWHACPEHGTQPKANSAWWAEKLARNRLRDAETEAALQAAGWNLVVVWEHEDPVAAAERVEHIVRTWGWSTSSLPNLGHGSRGKR